MRSELIAKWERDEAAVFEGWDFSYIKDRFVEEEPGWDYRALAKGLIKKSAAVLDVATGGGEVFSSLAPFPVRAIAVEGYRPNVTVARKRLEPLGVQVLEGGETPLPFAGNTFDLVLNRHGGFDAAEIYRVLQEKGTFLTQQVDGGNLIELLDLFDAKQKWPDHVLKNVRQRMQNFGFHIERAEEWKGKARFLDVARTDLQKREGWEKRWDVDSLKSEDLAKELRLFCEEVIEHLASEPRIQETVLV